MFFYFLRVGGECLPSQLLGCIHSIIAPFCRNLLFDPEFARTPEICLFIFNSFGFDTKRWRHFPAIRESFLGNSRASL